MSGIRILTERDLRRVVGLESGALGAVEAVFPLVSERVGSMPPIQRIDVPEHGGEIDIKSAYLPGYDGIAVKVSTGFFRNPERGLPSLGGLMIVFDTATGRPRAALFDNGYLTDLRTALAGAVAARWLAREDASVAAVIGAGVQARLQLEALALVRSIEHAFVWARDRQRAQRFVDGVGERLGIPVEVADSPGAVARAADVLVTATPATEPLVDAGMLHPGLHITAVGSDAEHKCELAPEVIAAADRFVCDHRDQSARLGELRAARAAGIDPSDVHELGEVVAGRVPGRRSDDEVTVCDLTGTGAQDTAIAVLAVDRCTAAGAGSDVTV